MSKLETKVGEFIARKLGVTVTSQFRVGGKPFDFCIDGKLLLEFDGPHHYKSDYFLWKDNSVGFEKQQQRDVNRHALAKQNDFPLLVVRQTEVDRHGRLSGDTLHFIAASLGYENA